MQIKLRGGGILNLEYLGLPPEFQPPLRLEGKWTFVIKKPFCLCLHDVHPFEDMVCTLECKS